MISDRLAILILMHSGFGTLLVEELAPCHYSSFLSVSRRVSLRGVRP